MELRGSDVCRATWMLSSLADYWTRWDKTIFCEHKAIKPWVDSSRKEELCFSLSVYIVLYSTKQGSTYPSPNQYSDVPIDCLLPLPTLMNKLKWEEAGINFIMFPVNSLLFLYSSVILGRACVSHLIKPPCKRCSCTPSIQRDLHTAITPQVHMLFQLHSLWPWLSQVLQ